MAISAIQRIGDATVRMLLRSPLHPLLSRRLMIITVVGRKTGREYANPVGYATDGDRLLVGTGAGWRRNLRPGEPVRIRLRGKEIQADAEVLADFDTVIEPYRIVLARNPVHGKFAGIGFDADGSPNLEDIRRALSTGAAVVRLTPRVPA